MEPGPHANLNSTLINIKRWSCDGWDWREMREDLSRYMRDVIQCGWVDWPSQSDVINSDVLTRRNFG